MPRPGGPSKPRLHVPPAGAPFSAGAAAHRTPHDRAFGQPPCGRRHVRSTAFPHRGDRASSRRCRSSGFYAVRGDVLAQLGNAFDVATAGTFDWTGHLRATDVRFIEETKETREYWQREDEWFDDHFERWCSYQEEVGHRTGHGDGIDQTTPKERKFKPLLREQKDFVMLAKKEGAAAGAPEQDLCAKLAAKFPDKTFADSCRTLELNHSISMASPERRAELERAYRQAKASALGAGGAHDSTNGAAPAGDDHRESRAGDNDDAGHGGAAQNTDATATVAAASPSRPTPAPTAAVLGLAAPATTSSTRCWTTRRG